MDPLAWLAALAACPPAFFLAVVLSTFLLEDATAIAVGALGAAMQVDPLLGVSALLVGTVTGDILLHLGGRLGHSHPFVRRQVARAPRVAALGRSAWMVAAARVVPGLRVPAYVGSGVAGMSVGRFAAVVLLTGLVWTPALYLLGHQLRGPEAWLGLGGLLLLVATAPGLARRRFGMAPRRGATPA